MAGDTLTCGALVVISKAVEDGGPVVWGVVGAPVVLPVDVSGVCPSRCAGRSAVT